MAQLPQAFVSCILSYYFSSNYMDYSNILGHIRKIVRVVNLESKRIEKEHGISIPQLLCLNFLSKQKGFISFHKDLKDYLQLNPSTVTGIINRLEKKGLIAKLPSADDKRSTPVVLTAKGLTLLQSTPEPLHEQITRNLQDLSESKLEQLELAFEMIIKFLNINDLDAAPIVTGETVIDESQDV
jgi:DNA-binding MarR family transcriptional regulator